MIIRNILKDFVCNVFNWVWLYLIDLGMDDEGDDDPVPLPNVNAAILKKVQYPTLQHDLLIITT